MSVRTRCASCGIVIELDADDPVDVIARGDRFWHRACIEVHNERYDIGTPAYHIPRSW